MIFKIKTSKRTMEHFQEIAASEHLQPFILSKLAIAASIKHNEKLSEEDFKTDNNGLELNRQTITGDFDLLFKTLIEDFENMSINEDEYMSKYLKAHLDRGAKLIYSEYRYGGDFILNLLNEKVGL